ncbi:MAG: xanthine dehydrogenase family protein molybdopterin-binding subunit [Alphaproteobacteria bacterium]|jgi:carbon-monoxide dehydrogenase large subunit|nr:xanthine dehydrogenase family protein molybdopterin-binding subunit [Alphaproteobacteria bacterium]
MAKFGISQSFGRREDRRFLTGQGRYGDDVRAADETHLYVLRSPHAHAEIGDIDAADARTMPGVAAVLTRDELAADGLGHLPSLGGIESTGERRTFEPPYPVLATDRVRHVGQAVAAVVADSLAQAKDAGEAIEVDYAPLDAVTEAAAALAPEAPRIWAEAADNVCLDWQMGDEAATARAFANAAHVSQLELVNNRLVVASMEPRGAVASYDPGTQRYTLSTGNQGAHVLRDALASTLGVPPAALRVVTPDVGGGFGMKAFAYPEQALALWAARRVGRPVRWLAERGEAFQADTQGRDHVSQLELALDGEGRFLGLRCRTAANLGAYLSLYATGIPTECYALALPAVYRIPAMHLRVQGVFTNTVPVDAYRGAGRPEASYAIERLVDQAAAELAVDPAELRRRNLIPAAAMPYRNAFETTYDSGDFARNLDEALARAEWRDFDARREAAQARGRLRGVGLAYYIELTGWADGDTTRLKFDASGGVTVYAGSISNGQGHETAYAQMVAERLSVAADRVRLVQGDTEAVAELSSGVGGSHFLQVAGPSLHGAADKVVAKAKRLAAHAMEASEADIDFGDGRFAIAGTDRSVGWSEVLALAFDVGGLPDDIDPGLDESHYYKLEAFTFPNGCHVAEVEIEPETGMVEVVRYTAIDDFGRVLNPALVEGQVHGGIAQGLGQALLERCAYDEASGQLLTGSFLDYAMPRADAMPRIDFGYNEVPCRTNPLGVKGCGEAGAIGAPPALINAVLDALRPEGVTHLDMPATPERVWRALQDANAGKSTAT